MMAGCSSQNRAWLSNAYEAQSETQTREVVLRALRFTYPALSADCGYAETGTGAITAELKGERATITAAAQPSGGRSAKEFAEELFEQFAHGERGGTPAPADLNGMAWMGFAVERETGLLQVYSHIDADYAYSLVVQGGEEDSLVLAVLSSLHLEPNPYGDCADEAAQVLEGNWASRTGGYLVLARDGTVLWYQDEKMSEKNCLRGTVFYYLKEDPARDGEKVRYSGTVRYEKNVIGGKETGGSYTVQYLFIPQEDGSLKIIRKNGGAEFEMLKVR